MADKEPRRRRRRKEASRKDETSHQDFGATQHASPQYKDSDQEQDDEPASVMPDHEPSKIAQIVFMFFLAVLVVLMGFVFAALKDSTSEQGDNGIQIVDSLSVESNQVDSFDKEATIGIEDVDESVIENLAQYQKDSDVDILQEERVEDSRKDTPVPPADLLPEEDLPVVETVDTLGDQVFEGASSASADIDSSEMIRMEESEVTVEDTSDVFDADEMDPTESYDTSTELPDLPSSVSDVPVTEAHVPFEMSTEAFDLDIEEGAEETTTASSFDSGFDADDDEEDILMGTETPVEKHEYSTALPDEDLIYANYEKADITSEGDYEIKEQLDDIDDILEKDDVEDVEPEDEFDFWQF